MKCVYPSWTIVILLGGCVDHIFTREINCRLIYSDICSPASKYPSDLEDIMMLLARIHAEEDHGCAVLRASNVILIEEFEFQMLSTRLYKAGRVYAGQF